MAMDERNGLMKEQKGLTEEHNGLTEERNGLLCWIKEHRKELIFAGISIGTLILIVLAINNREKIKEVRNSLEKTVKQPAEKVIEAVTETTEDIPPEPVKEVVTAVASNLINLPFEVSCHIRNLPAGCKASAEKIAEALENGIILMPGQTWVSSYIKGGAAA